MYFIGELIDFHLDILCLNLGSPKSGGWGSIPPRLAASVAHHLGVDGAADAVGQLGVELGQLVAAVHARLGDVPDSSGLNNVPDVVFDKFDIAIK